MKLLKEYYQKATKLQIIGIAVFLISMVAWLFVFIIPFMDLPLKTKAISITTCIIIGEVTFYGSIALFGKEIYKKYRSKMNFSAWFKTRKDN